MIPYATQSISEEDIQAVADALRSSHLTQGPMVHRFEEALCLHTGARYAVAVSSATGALHLACLALGVQPGKRVWTSPITFVASANCAIYCGGTIDFVDVDPETALISPDQLEADLEEASRSGTLPDVVIPVHFAGQVCDMLRIRELSLRYGFKIIEDASHAVGGYHDGLPVGAGKYSDLTVFSFHAIKTMTTGEGGMLLMNTQDLHRRLSVLRTHGITREASCMRGGLEGPWVYEQQALGYNYRMTDFQCALGVSQLQSLKDFINRRREIASLYDTLLRGSNARPLSRNVVSESAWHLYVVRLQDSDTRAAVYSALHEAGIGANVHYIPVHLQPYYRDMGFAPGDFPNAEQYYAVALSLPIHCRLTNDDVHRTASIVRSIAGPAAG